MVQVLLCLRDSCLFFSENAALRRISGTKAIPIYSSSNEIYIYTLIYFTKEGKPMQSVPLEKFKMVQSSDSHPLSHIVITWGPLKILMSESSNRGSNLIDPRCALAIKKFQDLPR